MGNFFYHKQEPHVCNSNYDFMSDTNNATIFNFLLQYCVDIANKCCNFYRILSHSDTVDVGINQANALYRLINEIKTSA